MAKTIDELEINKYLEDIKNKVVPEIFPEKIYLLVHMPQITMIVKVILICFLLSIIMVP